MFIISDAAGPAKLSWFTLQILCDRIRPKLDRISVASDGRALSRLQKHEALRENISTKLSPHPSPTLQKPRLTFLVALDAMPKNRIDPRDGVSRPICKLLTATLTSDNQTRPNRFCGM
jgi:hypothetical protein